MDSFLKVPSVLKILLIELFAVFFFPATATGIINEIRPGTFPAFSDLDGLFDWLMALAGPIFVTWVLIDIFRPRIKDEIWGIFYKVNFEFCSTHPSYVLIDLITIALVGFFLWLGMSGEFEMFAFWIALGTAIFFPAARLTAWYILGRKIDDPEVYDAYKPPLWAFGIFSVIFGGGAIIGMLL